MRKNKGKKIFRLKSKRDVNAPLTNGVIIMIVKTKVTNKLIFFSMRFQTLIEDF